MPRAATEKCRALVAKAEAQGACCFPTSASERRQLDRMVARKELVRPLSGLYANAALWCRIDENIKSLMIIRGLAKKHPSWVFCDMSAALLHGLWVSYNDSKQIHVVKPAGHKSTHDASIVFHAMKVDFVEIGGVRATTLERTVFDCCRLHPVRSSLGVADAALRLTGQSNDWLLTAFQQFSRRSTGWHVARYVAGIANGLSENGGESLARATMIMLGYQVPELQVELPNPIDKSTYRTDFLWNLPDGTRIAGELDGHDKYLLPEMTGGRDAIEVLTDERLRESRINALRIPMMRFSVADVRSPQRFARIMDAFGIPHIKRPQATISLPVKTQFLEIDGWEIELLVEYASAA